MPQMRKRIVSHRLELTLFMATAEIRPRAGPLLFLDHAVDG
jgi:hypothetical protein